MELSVLVDHPRWARLETSTDAHSCVHWAPRDPRRHIE